MACKVCPRTGQRMCGDEEIACVICGACDAVPRNCGTCGHMLDMLTSASCSRCRQIGNGTESMWVVR